MWRISKPYAELIQCPAPRSLNKSIPESVVCNPFDITCLEFSRWKIILFYARLSSHPKAQKQSNKIPRNMTRFSIYVTYNAHFYENKLNFRMENWKSPKLRLTKAEKMTWVTTASKLVRKTIWNFCFRSFTKYNTRSMIDLLWRTDEFEICTLVVSTFSDEVPKDSLMLMKCSIQHKIAYADGVFLHSYQFQHKMMLNGRPKHKKTFLISIFISHAFIVDSIRLSSN